MAAGEGKETRRRPCGFLAISASFPPPPAAGAHRHLQPGWMRPCLWVFSASRSNLSLLKEEAESPRPHFALLGWMLLLAARGMQREQRKAAPSGSQGRNKPGQTRFSISFITSCALPQPKPRCRNQPEHCCVPIPTFWRDTITCGQSAAPGSAGRRGRWKRCSLPVFTIYHKTTGMKQKLF